MFMLKSHSETHRIARIGWLRAAVLGANDGIISTASLLIGVAAANVSYQSILIAGAASLIAGAMSMAAGEYVSVSSQGDVEKTALQTERKELLENPLGETYELASIYVKRGLEIQLAKEVATQLMAKDALAAHARDELGITEISTARPFQAAIFSGCSFTAGAILPLLIILIVPRIYLIPSIAISALFFLGLLGAVAARVGNASLILGSFRVMIWGMLAMLASAGIGSLLGVTV
jgi:vacuolar iron transporter family protein